MHRYRNGLYICYVASDIYEATRTLARIRRIRERALARANVLNTSTSVERFERIDAFFRAHDNEHSRLCS